MVKNLLILRFGNEFFGATWNRNHIDNVQVNIHISTTAKSYSTDVLLDHFQRTLWNGTSRGIL